MDPVKLYGLTFIEREGAFADDGITITAEARSYEVLEEREDGTLVVREDTVRYTEARKFTGLELLKYAGDPAELISSVKETLATNTVRAMARGES